MIQVRWLLPILFITLPACSMSQGFDRPGIQETLHQRLNLTGGDETTNRTGIRPARIEPFRLGIYFVQTEFPTRQSVQTVEWLSAEKDSLIQRLMPLHDDRTVRDIVTLAESTALNLTRQELRQAAIRYGIDMLLLVDGIGAVDRHNNAYALLYPTLIGTWLAPGTVSDALFVMNGRLWDIRTDRMLDPVTAEGLAKTVGAAVLVKDSATLRQAKRAALEEFGERVTGQLRRFTNPEQP